MTDKKKITILERLLDERDEQIRELERQNVELQAMIGNYHDTDNDIRELRKVITETKRLNKEFNDINNEQLRIKNEFRKEFRKEMGRAWRRGFN